ncbi:hypothetical protein D3C83_270200 [compost metagenome]
MLSAGRAVTGSTMAAIDRQVSTAYCLSSRADREGSAAAGVGKPTSRATAAIVVNRRRLRTGHLT